MRKDDPRYVPTLVKIPRELLRQLDDYAMQNCGGNRSFAIRRAIEQLITGHAYENTASGDRRAKR